jgi:hypothetical protein
VVEENKDLTEAFRPDAIQNLFPHAISLLMDDEISVEISGNPNGAEFYFNGIISGRGLGDVMKAAMIVKAATSQN